MCVNHSYFLGTDKPEVKVKWLLQSDVFSEKLELLTDAITEQGMEYKIVKYVPFQDNEYHVLSQDDCVVSFGSINFINQVKRNGWTPNVWLNEKALECTTYYSYYGKYLINQFYTILPFAEFQRRKKEFFAGRDGLFIRPNSNMKEFAGGVFYRENFESDEAHSLRYSDIEPSTLIIIAPPEYIHSEWRFVIADRKAVTWSRYKTDMAYLPSPNAPQEAIDLANEIAQVEWRPSNVFIVDIGMTGRGKFGLIEIGAFNCAGLYMCDRSLIVKEISKVALEEYEETQ